MPFTFTECKVNNTTISGLYEIEPKVFGDARGYFFESYNEKDFIEAGLSTRFVQDNQSYSSKGVLRGLHYQTLHPQGKLVRAVQGEVFDIAVDIRNDSPTFGSYYGVVLSSEKQNQFYIPQGFAHGFCVLSETAIFAYKCTDFYHPEDDRGIIWNDETINIDWTSFLNRNGKTIKPLLSEKDNKQPVFDKTKPYFDMTGIWKGSR